MPEGRIETTQRKKQVNEHRTNRRGTNQKPRRTKTKYVKPRGKATQSSVNGRPLASADSFYSSQATVPYSCYNCGYIFFCWLTIIINDFFYFFLVCTTVTRERKTELVPLLITITSELKLLFSERISFVYFSFLFALR